MAIIRQRLRELRIKLPQVPEPVGNFQPCVLHNGLLYLSGQGPLRPDGTLSTGKVGADVSVQEAYEDARRAGLVLIAAMEQYLEDLDRIERIVKLLGMVNAAPDFTEHPKVINGCSDLLAQVFETAGAHARSAVGLGSLPGNITVEIEAIVAVKSLL